MGCNNSQFNDGIEDDDADPLNEEKTEYDELPSVTMILGEKIDKYFYCDKVLGIHIFLKYISLHFGIQIIMAILHYIII